MNRESAHDLAAPPPADRYDAQRDGGCQPLSATSAPPPCTTAARPRKAERPAATQQWLALAVAAAVLAVALVASLDSHGRVRLPGIAQPLPSVCLWQRFVGHGCPGCGLTRAFVCLGHGDVAAAWRFNPVALPLFALVVVQIPYRGWQLARLRTGRPALALPRAAWLAWMLAALLVLQWAARLVPW